MIYNYNKLKFNNKIPNKIKKNKKMILNLKNLKLNSFFSEIIMKLSTISKLTLMIQQINRQRFICWNLAQNLDNGLIFQRKNYKNEYFEKFINKYLIKIMYIIIVKMENSF